MQDTAIVHDALCFCDLTTGPDGELPPVEERLAEIKTRYGPDTTVYRFVERAGDELCATVRRVEASLADQPR